MTEQQTQKIRQAAFCIIYSKKNSRHENAPIILMHLREDGCFGFAGGMIEENETLEEGVIREVQEEYGYDLSPFKSKLIFVSSNLYKPDFKIHHYCLEVSEEIIHDIQSNQHNAVHFVHETKGIVRVPTETSTAFQRFLKNQFAGDAGQVLQKFVEEFLPKL
mmetsp:Transcript_20753/g.29137  ORF Transcript_20753/g.29137 Transcript_20753/m.29137 type:complete len:162 (-) Transcript_20753:317-802(-)